jgi:hypothetical protein
MSGFHAVQLTRPRGSLGGASVVQFSVPYVSLATTLNILISVILLPRLLELRRQVSLAGNLEGIHKKFISFEALVVESALPSGLFSFVFIILFGFQKVSSILFLPLLVQVMVRGKSLLYIPRSSFKNLLGNRARTHCSPNSPGVRLV